MKTLDATHANACKLARATAAWQAILDESLAKGFFGTASVEITVQDGTIQLVRRRVERIEK